MAVLYFVEVFRGIGIAKKHLAHAIRNGLIFCAVDDEYRLIKAADRFLRAVFFCD